MVDRCDSTDGPALNGDEVVRLQEAIGKVASRAAPQLSALPRNVSVVRWIKHLQRNVDVVFDKHNRQGADIACRKGCGHCCHVRVEALPAEIFRIAEHLRQRWLDNPAEQVALLDRLRAHARQTQLASDSMAGHDCPFLVNQLCDIYEVRPAVCRKGHSLDVQACQHHASTVPQSLPLLADAEALIQGVSQAYAHAGLPSGGFELVAGVLQALEQPEALQQWLGGDQPFHH